LTLSIGTVVFRLLHHVSVVSHSTAVSINGVQDFALAAVGWIDNLQVWFPGVHCDVGRGYPEEESGLSKLALQWMLGEAEQHGLRVDATCNGSEARKSLMS
jgi:hypothetical protein